MNKKLKSILIFTAGVGVGALVAYIILNRRAQTEYLGTYEETFDDVNDDPGSDFDENQTPDYKEIHEVHKDSMAETAAVRSEDNKVRALPRERYKKLVRRYDTLYNKNDDVDPAELERPEEDDAEEEEREFQKISQDYYNHNRDNVKPYVITTEEFAEDMNHFDKLTIYYYEDDQTLADENEEMIEDVASVVGDEALNEFGRGSDDPEIVYVRNEKMEIDYEVIRLSKSYKETVGGFTGGRDEDGE
jgi:hypothetical protein